MVSRRLSIQFPHRLRAPRGGRRLARSRSHDRIPACCKLAASAFFLLLPVGFISCNQSTEVEPSRTSETIPTPSRPTSTTIEPPPTTTTTARTTATTEPDNGGGGFRVPTPTTTIP